MKTKLDNCEYYCIYIASLEEDNCKIRCLNSWDLKKRMVKKESWIIILFLAYCMLYLMF